MIILNFSVSLKFPLEIISVVKVSLNAFKCCNCDF